MSKLETQSYKGVRDFYPEDQFVQNYIFSIWRKTLESYGYNEYNASIFEPSEIYKEKSGEEIVNEQTFTFIDRGGREVTLRPEMTPTTARMVAAKRRELGFPLRWYSIPNLFRYEAPQRGRLREHWQLNADIFGVKTIEADIEMITIAYQILKNFGATDVDFEIRLNTHGDKKELEAVILTLEHAIGIKNLRIDETLARGQAYYTGVVFEVFDTNKANSRSILGGGRFDNLTELFSDDAVPAVGFGCGDVTMKDFLETHNLLPEFRTKTDLFYVLKDTSQDLVMDFFNTANAIRENGVNIATDVSGREPGDMYKVAERNGIPYIAFADKESLAKKELVIKNMKTREESRVNSSNFEEILKIVRN